MGKLWEVLPGCPCSNFPQTATFLFPFLFSSLIWLWLYEYNHGKTIKSPNLVTRSGTPWTVLYPGTMSWYRERWSATWAVSSFVLVFSQIHPTVPVCVFTVWYKAANLFQHLPPTHTHTQHTHTSTICFGSFVFRAPGREIIITMLMPAACFNCILF